MSAISWPLVRKELRQSLRARATLIVENLYVLVLALVAGWQFYGSTRGYSPSPMWECGRSIFWSIAYLQAVLLGLVAAALTATTITTEREQKTEDLLLATPTRVREIVRSKLAALLVIGLTLVLLSIPVSVICLLLGGLTWQEVGLAYLVVVIWVGVAGSIGLLIGALVRRSMAAVPLAVVAAFVANYSAVAFAEAKIPHAALSGSGGLALLRNEIPLTFFGLHLPIWVACLVLCLPLVLCLSESAVDRVRLSHQRRPVAQRVWLLLLAVVASALALGFAITQPRPEYGPPWNTLATGLGVQGCLLLVVAAIFSSQGLGKRDLAALRNAAPAAESPRSARGGFVDGLFGSGPRAGARWSMLLSFILLVGWTAFWLSFRHDIGAPLWRSALATANLLAGVWVACLLAQVPAFWRRIRREWIRRLIALVCLAVVFVGPLAAAGIIHSVRHSYSPVAVVLMLTSPFVGEDAAYDPTDAMDGSAFAEKADKLLPLGVYPIACMLVQGVMLALVLRRLRIGIQAELARGAAIPPREAEATFGATQT